MFINNFATQNATRIKYTKCRWSIL